ncbi:MAG: Lrp/AsnC ligand binding domain-containing protein [Gemmatimonadetes bacterium]|nr:Lrp/AsnC ligand binding domain-containing protein [Gemmatimonadota bacterium]
MKAYIFINAGPTVKPGDLVAELRGISGIASADVCWGLPDIIAVVNVPDVKDFQTLVLDKLQKLRGVEQTDTHVVAM